MASLSICNIGEIFVSEIVRHRVSKIFPKYRFYMVMILVHYEPIQKCKNEYLASQNGGSESVGSGGIGGFFKKLIKWIIIIFIALIVIAVMANK